MGFVVNFQGSDEELNEAIEKSEEQLAEKEMYLKDAERELQRHQMENETDEKARSDLIVQKTVLKIGVKVGFHAFQ